MKIRLLIDSNFNDTYRTDSSSLDRFPESTTPVELVQVSLDRFDAVSAVVLFLSSLLDASDNVPVLSEEGVGGYLNKPFMVVFLPLNCRDNLHKY